MLAPLPIPAAYPPSLWLASIISKLWKPLMFRHSCETRQRRYFETTPPTNVIKPAMPAPTTAISADTGSVVHPLLPILPTEHTLRLRLLDTDTSNLHLLQHLDPIKPRTLRIDTTFIAHRDTRPLA